MIAQRRRVGATTASTGEIPPTPRPGPAVAGLMPPCPCWGRPGPGRMASHAQDMDGPGLDLHYEQDVQAVQQHRARVQKVTRHDAGRLSGHELPPRRREAARRRPEPSGGQDPADRPLTDPVSQADEFALDAAVTPAGGLSRAISSTSTRIALTVRGRPRARRGKVHRRRTRPACQRSRVRGETIRRSWQRRLRGSKRASAASNARSAQDSLGAFTWRCSTATWWRKRRISASLARSERASRASQPNTWSTATYANRRDTGTDSARNERCPRSRTANSPPQIDQVSGYDSVIGTHTASACAGRCNPLIRAVPAHPAGRQGEPEPQISVQGGDHHVS
jgi:hypothetical protein